MSAGAGMDIQKLKACVLAVDAWVTSSYVKLKFVSHIEILDGLEIFHVHDG